MNSPIVQRARPILGIDRHTGAFVALIPSASEPGKWHVTTALACDCKGYAYRGKCSHLSHIEPGPRPTRDSGAIFLRSLS